MRILGIDPGYATTGFGILQAERASVQLINYGTITTPTTLSFPERLEMLYDDMAELLDTVRPDAVAVEELFWGHNVTTGIGVSHGRGVILLAICKAHTPLFEYTPNQVKQAVVGYGSADKHQVMEMTRRILHMEKVAQPDDAADAIAIALCHARLASGAEGDTITMFYYLNGTVALLDANLAVIDCGGVGYACHTSNYTLARLQTGKPAKLFTYCNIKEDAFDIYGFSTREELDCFRRLIGVTGVGTKAALAILSAVSPDQLTLAVMTQDDKTITMAQGVGKKLAQRIILELKDKLGASQLELNTAQMAASGTPVRGSKTAEATAALVGLGYSQTEAAAALKGLDVENLSIEDIIRQALRAAARQ